MNKSLSKFLLKYPLEEMYSSEGFRSFAIPFVDRSFDSITYTELFQYSDLKNKYKINEKEYLSDNKDLEELINSKFHELSKGEQLHTQNKNKYSSLDDLSKKINFSNFEDCRELNFLQTELDDPSKLEHFTDWIIDYTDEIGLWQLKFPKKLYEIGCLLLNLEKDADTNDVYLKKLLYFSNLDDPLSAKRFFFTKGIYYLEENQMFTDRIEVDNRPDENDVYYLDDEKDDNPLNDDYFDEWYDVLVLDNDPL